MARTPEWPVKCEKRRLISGASQPESGPADRLLASPCSFLDLFLPVHSALLHSNGGSRNCTAPGSDPPRKAALMSRFAEDSTDRGSVVHFAQIFAILLANAGFLDREPDASEGRICRLFAGSFDQTSTKLCRAQLPAASGRISTHRSDPTGIESPPVAPAGPRGPAILLPRNHERNPSTMPFPHHHCDARRQPARLHELAGRSLPRRLAGDDPPLGRRRPSRLLPHTGRPAPLLA